jgi:hypothetical protein
MCGINIFAKNDMLLVRSAAWIPGLVLYITDMVAENDTMTFYLLLTCILSSFASVI